MTDPIRVTVTGMGIETCVGRDIETFWASIASGRSGIAPIRSFDASDYPCQIAGEVDFIANEFLTDTEVRRTSRFQQMLFASVHKAIEHRGGEFDLARSSLIVGTGGGGLPLVENEMKLVRDGKWRTGDRLSLLKTLPNMAAGFAAQKLGLTGPTFTISTACASSTDAIGFAVRMIRAGDVETAIVGGVDTWITPASIAGFCLMRALSTRKPAEATMASRPFDANRDGMVPSEGSGALILESAESARRSGGTIYAEIAGAASTCDGYHLVAPRDDGVAAARAITEALSHARLPAEAIEHVNAHGTSTRINDIVETRVLRQALGKQAERIPITSTKSMIGHTSGACGIIETIATILTIRHRFVPPTINLDNPDPDCDLDYTPLIGRKAELEVALKVNFGFGGQNSALVVRSA